MKTNCIEHMYSTIDKDWDPVLKEFREVDEWKKKMESTSVQG